MTFSGNIPVPTGGTASAGGRLRGSYSKSLLSKLIKQAKDYAKDQLIRAWGLAQGLARDYIQRGVGGLVRGLIGRIFKHFSVSAVVSTLIGGVNFIDNFDWQISDKEIAEDRRMAIIQGAARLGGAFGSTLGWLLCGQIGQAITFKVDPAMASAIRQEVSEEAYEEITQIWKQTALGIFDLATEQSFYFMYGNARKAIKNSKLAQKLIGKERLDRWGAEDARPFSFAQWRREQIEKIPNPAVREFVEEFGEELWDSCQEAFMVVASSIDSHMALQRSQIQSQVWGDPVVMDVTPNREESDQTIRVYATEATVRQEVSSVLSQHQVISGYDLGEIVEGGIPSYVSKHPHSISAIIHWSARPTPPFSKKGEKAVRKQFTIPNLKRSGWTWRDVQRLAGGRRGIRSGRYKCWVRFSNNSKTAFSASSFETAEAIVDGLATLSEAEIVRKSEVKTKKTTNHNEGNNNFPEDILVYPSHMTILKSGLSRSGKVRAGDNRKTSRLTRKFHLYFELDNPQQDEAIQKFLTEAFMDRPA